ncbi:MAG TPA: type II CAAX endopeptidase family protein [Anaerolineales bacterium]|nr:type II CAAX endopeptidase family protein [Anaerolineales bacterium]
MNEKSKTLREIVVFLGLTFALSALAYIPIIREGTISGAQSPLGGLLMLAPGLAAVITYLVFERSLRPVGWQGGEIVYLLLGLAMPIIYCLLEYGVIWSTGWGKYNGQFPRDFPAYLLVLLFTGTLSALLEEVGWRGFLVPQMIKLTSFTMTAIITGLIWAVWHYPLIIYSNVRLGNTPLLYSLVCFTIFVVGLSFAAAWLRLRSGSVWASTLLHGSHNVFMLHVFNVLTTDSGGTWLLLGEYGAMTAVVGLWLAVLFWRPFAASLQRIRPGLKKTNMKDQGPKPGAILKARIAAGRSGCRFTPAVFCIPAEQMKEEGAKP